MAMQRTLVSLAVIAIMLIKLAMAVDHTVGGSNGGWDSSTDLQTWTSAQKFAVGDKLIFQYTPNHDVLEVSKADYDSCQSSKPIKSYNDGSTTIPLSSKGKRYFICGTIGHCIQGMKIEVDTLASSDASPRAASPSPAVPSVAPETSPSSPPPSKSPESSVPSSDSPLGSSPSSEPIPPSSEFPNSLPPVGSSPSSPSAASTSVYKGSFMAGFIAVGMLLAF